MGVRVYGYFTNSVCVCFSMLGKDHLNKVVRLCLAELEEAKSSGAQSPLLISAVRGFSTYEEKLPKVAVTGRSLTG